MVSPGWSIGCILLTLGMSACGLEVIGYDSQQVICSQGLSECTMKDEMCIPPPSEPKNDAVDVRDLRLQAKLCCKDEAPCALCLVIDTELYIHPNIEMEDEGYSGHDEDDSEKTRNPRASVKVCYRTSSLPVCKRVEFAVNLTAPTQQNKAQLSLVITNPAGVSFSSTVSVSVQRTKPPNLQRNIEVPSLDEVCSPDLQERIEECEVPTLNPVINRERNQMELQVVGKNERLYPNVCLQYETDGKCEKWNRTTIPLYFVTSCMCLQAWWDKSDRVMRSRRSLRCPFINHPGEEHKNVFQRTIWQNVSVSVVQGHMSRYDDGAGAGVMLSWNLSAPCRLEAEVWPCHRTAGVGENSCKELKGFRQQLSNGTWRQNSKRHWENSGEFEDINLQLSPCVMVKVKGMEKALGPFCFNDTGRWRWSLLVGSMVLLVCLTALIFYLLHDTVKRWVWSWHHGECVKIGGRGHVVLLSPPDVESVVSESVCRLGSLLRDKGFSVSVDQWSRTQQCSLGPLPWLHSQLLKLDSLGGQVMLVLTQKAWERAEEWTQQRKEAQGKGEDRGLPQILSPYSDVFTALLCVIQADKQLGRAGERFLLVDFESHPAQPPSGDRSLPEPLWGLRLFHLPSQTQALLSELTVGRRGRGSGRRKRTGGGNGGSNGWAAGTQQRLDQQRTPPHKCLGVEKNWEITPLKQQPSKACHAECNCCSVHINNIFKKGTR
ncbi:interleukin-17 receptor C isoform X1 [Centroberyx affinis]|uniref:interleukin-17 receptor C isoform X1 n=1 Tax=Centroberyx affinis TaxID=166261 RepID=UPI003A5C3A96